MWTGTRLSAHYLQVNSTLQGAAECTTDDGAIPRIQQRYGLRRSIVALTGITMMAPFVFAQSKVSSQKGNSVRTRSTQTKTLPAPYSTTPINTETSPLPFGYKGNDIEAVFNAIKASPTLKDKSEFETSSEFQKRVSSFSQTPILGELTAQQSLAFALEPDSYSVTFKYDADLQIMTVEMRGRPEQFLLDKDKAKLNTIRIRSFIRSEKSYVATNGFGAEVAVKDTYSEDYGLTFPDHSWPFAESVGYQLSFKYLLPLDPQTARSFKDDGRVLLIFHLDSPWFRHTVNGQDATIDYPYKTTTGENYIVGLVEQIWFYSESTGQIYKKITMGAADDQMELRMRQTPILLDVSTSEPLMYEVSIDDGPSTTEVLTSSKLSIAAKHTLKLTLQHPRELSTVKLLLNGKTYIPDWHKDSTRIGSVEFIRSAALEISVP